MAGEPRPLIPEWVGRPREPFLRFDPQAFLASDLNRGGSPDAVAGALRLWCRSLLDEPWPSLPADEPWLLNATQLSHLPIDERREALYDALQGFVLCSNGRLYHWRICLSVLPVIDAKVRNTIAGIKSGRRRRAKRLGGDLFSDVSLDVPPEMLEYDAAAQHSLITAAQMYALRRVEPDQASGTVRRLFDAGPAAQLRRAAEMSRD